MNDHLIESLLRKAPQPPAPDGLRERLAAVVVVPARAAATASNAASGWRGWFRLWWPALGYALAMLTCVTLLAVQTVQLDELRRENERLRASLQASAERTVDPDAVAAAREATKLQRDNHDMQRWREEAERLRARLGDLPALRAENQRLRAQAQAGAGDEPDPLADEQDKAKAIQCVSHLKQLGLGARVYAVDNGEVFPDSFLGMSNELSTPKVLWCPKDVSKVRVSLWSQLTPGNISYEFLAPGVSTKSAPNLVVFRCPIHGHIGLLDGSVQSSESLTNGTLRLEQKDGQQFLVP